MELLVVLILVGCVLLTGGLLAVTPWLMPKTECFAVTVPEGARRDPRLAGFRRRYALIVGVATLACSGILAAFAASAGSSLGKGTAFVGVLVGAMLVPTVLSFGLMLHFRRRVMAVKRVEGWAAPRPQAAAVVAEDDVPHAISLAWNLLYVPVVLVTATIGVVAWPAIPDQIPLHADFSGTVNDWAPKSIGSVFFPVLVQLFMIACFLFCHWSILRSKRPTSPGAPVTSALAYGLFARAQSIYLLATGVLVTAALGLTFMLSAMGVLSLGGAGAIVAVAVIPVLLGSVAIALVYGQAGSRLFRRMEAAGANAGVPSGAVMPADDDDHWKLGIFYVNRDDASLFLPERFGVGWTLNLGRPAAWAVVGGFVAVMALFVVLVFIAIG